MLRLRDHGNNDITLLRHFGIILTADSTQRCKLCYFSFVNIGAKHGIIVLLNNIFAHAFAHNAQTDKSDFHCCASC